MFMTIIIHFLRDIYIYIELSVHPKKHCHGHAYTQKSHRLKSGLQLHMITQIKPNLKITMSTPQKARPHKSNLGRIYELGCLNDDPFLAIRSSLDWSMVLSLPSRPISRYLSLPSYSLRICPPWLRPSARCSWVSNAFATITTWNDNLFFPCRSV